MNLDHRKIAIVGLGYVGLPLAVEFARFHDVVGFDIQRERVSDLLDCIDRTLEVSERDLQNANRLTFTTNVSEICQCTIFIVTVPTPIDKAHRPDLKPLVSASKTVGRVLKPGDIVIYESTVFPGCTRHTCVPILERVSGLTLNQDFHVGYSPERINPGDRQHRLSEITKVTSGSNEESAVAIDRLYGRIITAGTHKAPSIDVAEAAKVIENTQRDLNIALMNELSIIFHRLGIDTNEVLDAASTKWNFLPFEPGLVGGHCIGVDPYYLTHRAQEVGYHPEVILAGRRINDFMSNYVTDRLTRLMMRRGHPVVGSRIIVLGLAFKENCPDLRNSKIIDIVHELRELNVLVDVYDPWVSNAEAKDICDLVLMDHLSFDASYDAILLGVGHDEFQKLGASKIRTLGKEDAVFFDVKSVFGKSSSDSRL